MRFELAKKKINKKTGGRLADFKGRRKPVSSFKHKMFNAKSADESSSYHFEGYASTFGNTDRDGDVMESGCFDETIKTKSVVPMCLNHDRNKVIGKMELSVDEKGLKTIGTFNLNDPEAQKIYDLMKMGAIDSFSIGFFVKDFEPMGTNSQYSGLRFKEVEIFEVSVVTVPSNPEATVDIVKEFSTKQLDERIALANMKQDIMNKLAKI